MPGYVHVYTGDGKGKTTAALGLALRAAGAQWKVFIAQFVKGTAGSELAALGRFDELITVRQFGRSQFVCGKPQEADLQAARQGLAECAVAIASGDYSLVILDEANVAVKLGLFPVDDLLALIDGRPDGVELVLTGRNAHARLVQRADLVTEMLNIKHYYNHGVAGRTGIEK